MKACTALLCLKNQNKKNMGLYIIFTFKSREAYVNGKSEIYREWHTLDNNYDISDDNLLEIIIRNYGAFTVQYAYFFFDLDTLKRVKEMLKDEKDIEFINHLINLNQSGDVFFSYSF